MPSFVHFPHPGPEHVPDGDDMPWNRGSHARKFMLTEGRYLWDPTGSDEKGDVVFWGEWEGPSRVVRRWQPDGELPRFLHRPFWEVPNLPPGPRQNTDPWVFGDAFRYSNCKQLWGKPKRPTALQRLDVGSLILFGSTRQNHFVLDTAFVVGERVGEYRPGDGNPFGEDDAFFHSTLDSLTTYDDEITHSTLTLYRGGTPADPVNGMFSFAPCHPHKDAGHRFARPIIELPGELNPRSRRAVAGAGRQRAVTDVASIWRQVVEQVMAQGAALAWRLELPHRDSAPR